MKKITTCILAVFLSAATMLNAQSVGINSDGSTPETSAMLDVKSTDKGFLAPRMTVAQRDAMPAKTAGLLIYQTDSTPGYYYYSGSAWLKLDAGLTASQWTSGTGNISYSGGNVGVGTTTPLSKLDIRGLASASGLALNMNFDGATWRQVTTGYGAYFQVDNATGNFYFWNTPSSVAAGGATTTPGQRLTITSSGNVGIGTTEPTAKFQINDGTVANGTNTQFAIYGGRTNTTNVEYANIFFGERSDGGGAGSKISSFTGNSNYETGLAFSTSKDIGGSSGLTEAMRIGANGNVGIGTTIPSQKLDVAGSIKISNQSGPVATPDKIDLGSSYSNGATRDQLKIYLVDIGGTQRYGFGIGVSSDIQYHSQVAHDFYVDNSKRFSVTGSGGANTSDRRLKRDILPLNKYGLQQVMQLNPVTYIFKNDNANTPQVGFIAQEVKQIIPEVVTGKEGDLSKGESLGIVYGNLVPVLTKAIQEQQATIETLKTAKEAQQKEIDELKELDNKLMNK